ncbi:hypothetical protein [Halobacterium hubeiense]|uniref:hypothetical protein n=1 Tax=Halobacterium hubeiense TaxID=1407499 RepID=UPI000B7EDAE9|nr:hypothetical protein [Halobacterium hubeiense]
MSHENPARNKGTAQDSGESTTTTSDETAPFVCTRDGCFAAFGSREGRDEHEDSDHDDEDAPTEVAA